MPQWPVPSNNSILVAGIPLEMEFEAYGTIWPGMGVEYTGANSVQVQACDTLGDNLIGIADKSQASLTGRGAWRKDVADGLGGDYTSLYYTTDDELKVISGPVIVMLLLAPLNQTINEGDKLQCYGTVAGTFTVLPCGLTTTDPCALVAEAMESVTTTTLTLSQYIMAKLLI